MAGNRSRSEWGEPVQGEPPRPCRGLGEPLPSRAPAHRTGHPSGRSAVGACPHRPTAKPGGPQCVSVATATRFETHWGPAAEQPGRWPGECPTEDASSGGRKGRGRSPDAGSRRVQRRPAWGVGFRGCSLCDSICGSIGRAIDAHMESPSERPIEISHVRNPRFSTAWGCRPTTPFPVAALPASRQAGLPRSLLTSRRRRVWYPH